MTGGSDFQWFLHHNYQVSLSGRIKFKEDSGVHMQLTKVIFRSLDWMSTEHTVLMQLTSSAVEGKYTRVSLRTDQKLRFSQLLDHHGTS